MTISNFAYTKVAFFKQKQQKNNFLRLYIIINK